MLFNINFDNFGKIISIYRFWEACYFCKLICFMLIKNYHYTNNIATQKDTTIHLLIKIHIKIKTKDKARRSIFNTVANRNAIWGKGGSFSFVSDFTNVIWLKIMLSYAFLTAWRIFFSYLIFLIILNAILRKTFFFFKKHFFLKI